MSLTENIMQGLERIIDRVERNQKSTESALLKLRETALTDEIYCLEQVSLTLGNTIEILKEIRRNYAKTKISNKDLG